MQKLLRYYYKYKKNIFINIYKNKMFEVKDKRRKLMWYGWQKEASNEFKVGHASIERWRSGNGQGMAVKMKRKELIDWCKGRLEAIGESPEEIESRIKEAFGEC